MVADAVQCSEGVSFFGVRRVFLADVPATPTQLIQQCGRAIRMYGHRGLPENEQTVNITMFVAVLPPWLRSSLGAWCLRVQSLRLKAKEMMSQARKLLRSFHKVGIVSLKDLKERLDAFGARKSAPKDPPLEQKTQLDSRDVVNFLETIGLWRQAEQLQEFEERRLRGDKRSSRCQAGRLNGVCLAQDPASPEPECRQQAKANELCHAKALETTTSASDNGKRKTTEMEAGHKGMLKRPLRPHHLCRSIQALYMAESLEYVAAGLTMETADEKALRDLANAHVRWLLHWKICAARLSIAKCLCT
eukprot:gnl/MRDRNA2_/MRDRNA2_68626_c0_seq2.p1 gnl/MRDRNA2_/MRDRNA2_68626_c0~~gnl/MRDRNA2_/MRDRNA2_68626_c0_seq2.p1  ORF type:complete len:330 (+),score=51.66 gnl/MRDRNA2_/MRDRNA2_68626_c0_seq2:80-991(+)